MGQSCEDLFTLSKLPKLQGAGGISIKDAEHIAHERIAEFYANRKETERQVAAEARNLQHLKRIINAAKINRSGGREPRQPCSNII